MRVAWLVIIALKGDYVIVGFFEKYIHNRNYNLKILRVSRIRQI
jgi:hypothetical protein